jgi:transcriptional regulator with XRE-family HTH domain
MTEQQRGRRAIEVGPTGKNVAQNLARLRERHGLTTRQLAGALESAGRPIPASGITRMEKGERVVTVDELTALAVVLGVSPSALLMPFTERPDTTVEVTGRGPVPAMAAWEWADGRATLGWDSRRPADDQFREWILFGWPAWLRPFREHQAYSSDQYERSEASGQARGAVAFTEDGRPIWIKATAEEEESDGPGVD